MDVREKLVELLKSAENQRLAVALCCTVEELIDIPRKEEYIAEYLVAHGVTVQDQVGFDGEWIVNGQEVFCSHCNEESGYNAWGASAFSNYCPNCGKKMMPQPPKGE